MLKKSISILSISAFFFAQAQNVTVLRNTMDVYSGGGLQGTAKYNAMAGSMGALGGDASAAVTNPAGVGVAISSSISGTLAINNINNNSSKRQSQKLKQIQIQIQITVLVRVILANYRIKKILKRLHHLSRRLMATPYKSLTLIPI